VAATLLLVEDDAATRGLFEALLTSAGFIVQGTGNGADALARLRGGSFDLVVLDLLLPALTGLAVLKAMRQHSATAELPVIVVTGAVLSKQDLMDLHGVTVLRKPVNPEDLIEAVDTALAGRGR
jgi:two-component system chemotaxis response regulator CheY